jgi:glycosyltransferase involved in cell wall biosynthesis
MPNALVEAMVCRTPVAAADCRSGPREILADGRYGRLVEAGNSGALADALDDAIQHYSEWVSLTEPARRHVENLYSLQPGIERLEAILAQVASAAP